MNPKTLCLFVWVILLWSTTRGISSITIPINNPQQPSLLVDFDECVSFIGGSQFDYSEFTAAETNFTQCSQISLVSPSYVYRTNIAGNAHSCTPGIGNSIGMCVDGVASCNYLPNSAKAVKFNVQVVPGQSGVGSLDGISFFEQAPEIFNIIRGDQGLNNYPQFLGLRVSVNGVEIYRQENVPTERFWTFKQFDFTNDEDFFVSTPTIFNFEILPYCPIGNGSQQIIWDIDQLLVSGNCNDIFSGTVSTNDLTDICANNNTGGIVQAVVENAFGPLESIILTDGQGTIIQVQTSSTFDFRGFPNGVYNIYNIVYEPGLNGLIVNSNISNLDGCFDLSSPLTISNNVLEGGNITFEDGFIDAVICDNTFESNQLTMVISDQVGQFITYLLTDNNNNILQTFSGPGFNFSTFPEGTYNIIAAVHNGQLINSVLGVNISDLRGCFALSNTLRVFKSIVEVGEISIDGQTQVTLCSEDDLVLSPIINGMTTPNTRWVLTNSSGVILNIFSSLPIDFNNIIENELEIRLISFVGRLTNFEVNALLSDVEGCLIMSNPIQIGINRVEGGTITLEGGATDIDLCIDDGIQENLALTLLANVGLQNSFLLLDSGQNIIDINNTNIFNFENTSVGVCTIVNISYEGIINNLSVGNNISSLEGCFDLSNVITVTRLERFNCDGGCNVDGGVLTLNSNLLCTDENGTPFLNGQLSNAVGNVQVFALADLNGDIINLFTDFPIDIDSLAEGEYAAYNISSFDDTGVDIGDNIDNIDHDCFDVSDPIFFTIIINIAGTVSLEDGTTSMQICSGDSLNNVLRFINSGTSQFYQYFITDSSDLIIDELLSDSFDFSHFPIESCRIWGVASSEEISIDIGQPINSLQQGSACILVSDNFVELNKLNANGGVLNIENSRFCVGDGNSDLVNGVIEDAIGNYFNLLVTTEDSTIILMPENFPFDVDSLAPGNCLIWSLATINEQDIQIGSSLSEISDECFDFSEPVSITRTENFGGVVSLSGGVTEIEICAGDTISDILSFQTTGVGVNYQYIITDTSDIIIGLPSGNEVNFNTFSQGICRVYGIAHNAVFNQSPGDELTLPMIPNLCFDFSQNFILVTKTNEGDVCGPECLVSSGVFSISASQFCVGDEQEDLLDANLVGAVGDFTQWIITDVDSTIIILPDMLPIELDTLPPGDCIIWHLSSTDTIALSVGQTIDNVSFECFEISEGISFSRIENFGGAVSLSDNITEIDICLTDTISNTLFFFNTGSANIYRYVITDETDTIIALPLEDNFDFGSLAAGVCRVYGVALQADVEYLIGQEFVEVNNLNNCIDFSTNFIVVNKFDSGEECGEMSCNATGGQLSLDNTFFCVGNGEENLATGSITGATGNTTQLVITNLDSLIIGISNGFPININNFSQDSCLIWNLSSDIPLDLLIGTPITSVQSLCFDLSNAVLIEKKENFGGIINFEDGSQEAFVCVGDLLSDNLTLANSGSGDVYQYIVTDTNNIILIIQEDNTIDFEGFDIGVCRVWGIAHTIDLELMEGDSLVVPEADLACFDLSSNFVVVTRSQDSDICNSCALQRNTCTGAELGYIFNDATVERDSSICIPLRVTNFDSITGFQGAFMWDPTVLMITGIQNISLTGLDSISSFNIDTIGGIGSFMWSVGSGGPSSVTLIDSSILFEICFDAIGDIDDQTLLKVVSTDLVNIQALNESGDVEFCIDDGCISIIENSINQELVTLIAEDVVTTDTTVCVDVRTNNFIDITGVQFAMQWDSTFMCFDSITNNNTMIGIFSGAVFQGNNADRLRFTWTSTFTEETTLPDSSLLFSVCFDIKDGNCDSTSFLNFINDEIDIEISRGTVAIPFDLDNGSVSLIGCTNIVEGEEIVYSLYPNPSDEYMTIEIVGMPNSEHTIQVHNRYGQILYNEKKKDIFKYNVMNVSDWTDGIYYITIISNNKKRTEKFIVLH